MTRKSNDGGKGRSTGRPSGGQSRGAPRSEGRAPRGEGGFKPRGKGPAKGPSKGPGKGPAKGPAKSRSGDGFKPRTRASEGSEGRKDWFETRGESRPPRRDERGEGRTRRSDERGEKRFTGEGRAYGPKKDFGKRPPRRDFSEGRETGDLKPWEQGDAPREKRREDGGGFRKRREDTQRSGTGPRKFGRDDRGRDPSKRVSKGDFKPKTDFDPNTPKPAKEQHERIAKVMARAGLCSRREAEEWIEAGRVSVNGEVLTSPARDVSDRDTILVDGKALPTRERTRLFLYHKPRGLVTTSWDPEGRPTVFQNLPKGLPRVVTIGRLDINTEGLLLLTNDGGLARVISLPDTGWLRRYRVRAYGNITQPDLDALRDGIEIDGMRYGSIEAELQREQGDNVWLTIGLREGKNREVKRVLEHLGMQVNRLIRISFGPFQLGDLEDGAVEEVKTRVLQEQLGPELTAEAQCDFDAPVFVYGDEDDFHPRKRELPDDKRGGLAHKRARRNEEFEAEERPRPPRRNPLEIKTSVWRADDPELSAERRRAPRRGADAKQDRLDTGAMEHKRTGRVTSRKGKSALVERVVRGERPRRPREDEFEARPRRDREEGERRPGKSFDAKAPRGQSAEGHSERGGKPFGKTGEKAARRGGARAEPGGRGYSGKATSGKGPRGKSPSGKGPAGKGPAGKGGPRGGKPAGGRSGGRPGGPSGGGGRSGGAPRGRR
jgi:23S rRNA pseudouridine2605 synthase